MKTIKTLTMTGAAAGLLALLSTGATAATIDWNNNYRTGSGGEFTLVDTGFDLSGYAASTKGVIGADSFQTFCIEKNETIAKGATVTATVNPAGAINGGLNGGNPDQVSQGTAYLYSQFAQGILSGYNYTPGSLAGVDAREITAGQLQNAIWYLEDEHDLATAGGAGNPFLAHAVSALGLSLAQLKLDNGTDVFYGVQAVNLTSGANGRTLNQDQLYYDPGLQVPDGGASLMLLGLALAGLGSFKRFAGKKG